jgi:hypothetical protein
VRVVVNPPADALGTVLVLAAEPEVEIGVVEGDAAYQLFQVVSAFLLPDGRLVVANAGTFELRAYGPDGGHLVSFGTEGDGPGEFRRLAGAWPFAVGDSIAVWDSEVSRLSLFDAGGTFSRSLDLRQGTDIYRPSVRGVFEDGSFLVTGYDPDEAGASGHHRVTVRHYRLAADGQSAHSLGAFPGREYMSLSREGMSVSMAVAFGANQESRAAGGRLLLAATEDLALRWVDLDGSLAQVARQPRAPLPVSEADFQRVRDRFLSSYDAPPDFRTIMENLWDAMPRKATAPAFDRVVVTDAGLVWMEAYRPRWEDEAGQDVWYVFGSDGIVIGTVRTPWDLEILSVSDRHVVGLVEDELEVERVRLYPYNWVGGGG